jgi:hypothetical protein
MLKQVFDREQLTKSLSSSDIWQWDLLSHYGNIEAAIDHILQYWKATDFVLSPIEIGQARNKAIYIPSKMEDFFSIKLLDRFIRRIYKVQQADRNRIIRQLITLLKDSGKYHIIRLDIKDCFEKINFKTMIDKFEDEPILAPECIKLLYGIHNDLVSNHGLDGLPRGLSISPTLAELYLETLDKKIASHSNVIYNARYVDDLIIIMPIGKENSVQNDIVTYMNEMGLSLNENADKYFSGATNSAEFDYLGYSIKVSSRNGKSNLVNLKISNSKLNIIKRRITLSFIDYKKTKNLSILKRRIEYLCMLKTVKKGKNGNLLAGLAHNYQYVTDNFECLKPVDGFLCKKLSSSRFKLTLKEQNTIKKISIYVNAKNRNVGKFSRNKTAQLMRAWKNV